MDMLNANHRPQWESRRRTDLVLKIVRGKMTVEEASRIHQVSAVEINCWIEEALHVVEASLEHYPRIVLDLYERRIAALQAEYIDTVQKRDAFREYYRRMSQTSE